jgi:ubiquinone/menaquinone biosynthesis C-methylase UbiE
MLKRFREWRIDRMTDRVARRPHGRKAREVYGADDVHSFAWEPVLAALALGSADRLLDVGCGGGVFLRRALETGCDAVGLDHSPEMVALARANSGAHVVEGRAEELPFAEGEFTAVSCIVAFFFMDDPVRVLSEFRRVLDPTSGRLAIFTTPPEAKGTPAAPYPLATRGHFYTDAELEALPLAAGFGESRVTRTEIDAQLLVAR